ncbi:MAG: hypothetical protein PHF05_06385 [Candidatus Izemoplasmatales bacterium]|nr:hypothetical protein [Candidatus Izemoplasmatales bacterium]
MKTKICVRCKGEFPEDQFVTSTGRVRKNCADCTEKMHKYYVMQDISEECNYIKSMIGGKQEKVSRCMCCSSPFNYEYYYACSADRNGVMRERELKTPICNFKGLVICDDCRTKFIQNSKKYIELLNISVEELELINKDFIDPFEERKCLELRHLDLYEQKTQEVSL